MLDILTRQRDKLIILIEELKSKDSESKELSETMYQLELAEDKLNIYVTQERPDNFLYFAQGRKFYRRSGRLIETNLTTNNKHNFFKGCLEDDIFTEEELVEILDSID